MPELPRQVKAHENAIMKPVFGRLPKFFFTFFEKLLRFSRNCGIMIVTEAYQSGHNRAVCAFDIELWYFSGLKLNMERYRSGHNCAVCASDIELWNFSGLKLNMERYRSGHNGADSKSGSARPPTLL